MNVTALLEDFPRERPPLSPDHRRIQEEEYRSNREGRHFAQRMATRLEETVHRTIARRGRGASVLELGAGTLNHLRFEEAADYDVVEPFHALYANSVERQRVRHFYDRLEELPDDAAYQRILSMAVLEHLEDLPAEVARCGLLLRPGGLFQVGIPTEGGFLWGLAWRLTTGVAFRLRTGLPYAPIMRHEHINSAREIMATVAWFFDVTHVRRFPLPHHHASFYTYFEAENPRRDRCEAFLQRRTARAPASTAAG